MVPETPGGCDVIRNAVGREALRRLQPLNADKRECFLRIMCSLSNAILHKLLILLPLDTVDVKYHLTYN